MTDDGPDTAQYATAANTDGEPETVVPSRPNPRDLVAPVADDVEFVERGQWIVTASGAVYRDVMVGGLFMEGFRIGAIEHIDGETFTFEVIENFDLEDKERFLEVAEENGGDPQ